MSDTQALSNQTSSDAFSEWSRQYRTQKRRVDEENGTLRNIVKRAKADGVNTKEMITAVHATKLDPEEVAKNLRDQIYYMNVLRIPIQPNDVFDGWQASVTDQTRAQDDEYEAQDKGYSAGRIGTPIEDCPYAAGTELQQQWRVYWQRGKDSYERSMGPNEKAAPTSRARPVKAVASKPAAKKPAKRAPPRAAGRSRKNGAAQHLDA